MTTAMPRAARRLRNPTIRPRPPKNSVATANTASGAGIFVGRHGSSTDLGGGYVTLRHPLPAMGRWAVSPDFARILVDVILDRKPGLILELGSGVSTLLCGYCLERNGHGTIVSVEHEDQYVRATVENVRKHRLDPFVRVIHAPLRDITLRKRSYSWYDKHSIVDEIGSQKVDILIVDGPPAKIGKETRYPAIPRLFDRLADRAIVLVDDAGRPDERKIVRRWVRKFPTLTLDYLRWTEKGTAILKRGL